MNTIVVGWNVSPAQRSDLAIQLRRLAELYPGLDPTTLHFDDSISGAVIGCITTRTPGDPQRFVDGGDGRFATFDGMLVDPVAAKTVTDARDVTSDWQALLDRAEGQFVLVRSDASTQTIEVATDPIGMKQVYVARQGATYWLSTNAGILRRLVGISTLDPVGTALFLTLGWAGADRTLDAGIEVLDGGVVLHFQKGTIEPDCRPYFRRSELPNPQAGTSNRQLVQLLGEQLSAVTRSLPSDEQVVRCSLTGGRDSRVVAAAMIAGGTRATYYTDGEGESDDIRIARHIAAEFGLVHEVTLSEATSVADHWARLSRRTIEQNDGLISLHQAVDALHLPDKALRHTVTIGGVGGEIARNYYTDPKFLFGRRGKGRDAAVDFLCFRLLSNKVGLIKADVVDTARTSVADTVDALLDDGFGWIDIPDAFYGFDRVRRWAGTQTRKLEMVTGCFMPLCTRPWYRAAFSVNAAARWSEQIPHDLIAHLVPGLEKVPLEREGWRPRHAAIGATVVTARKQWKRHAPDIISGRRRVEAHARAGWLEANDGTILTDLRDRALDQESASTWEYVDRHEYERLTSPSTSPDERERSAGTLLAVGTILGHEAQE